LVGENILETLDKFIKEENIDIISLTTHKRNMISRLFNPSIARKMVFHSKTPLLVFHA
jgi:nucleotide-binding universal stress UspA family protein